MEITARRFTSTTLVLFSIAAFTCRTHAQISMSDSTTTGSTLPASLGSTISPDASGTSLGPTSTDFTPPPPTAPPPSTTSSPGPTLSSSVDGLSTLTTTAGSTTSAPPPAGASSSTAGLSTTAGSTVPGASTTIGSSTDAGLSTTSGGTLQTGSTTGSTVSGTTTTGPASTTTTTSQSSTSGSTVASGSTLSTNSASSSTQSATQSSTATTATAGASTTSTAATTTASTTKATASTTTASRSTASSATTTTSPGPTTFPPPSEDGVGYCRSQDGDALGSCFLNYLSTLPDDLSTNLAIKSGANKYFSPSNLDEADMQRTLLAMDLNDTVHAMAGVRAVLKAQRVRIAYKTQFLTQASDFSTGVGDTVRSLAAGYVNPVQTGQDYQFDFDDVEPFVEALLNLYEKQMSARMFAIALRKVPPLLMKPIILNIKMVYAEEYKNLSHPKSQDLIREVSTNFGTLVERNNGIQRGFVIISLTPGSVDVNAEVTYEKTNPNATTDPLDLTGTALTKDARLGTLTVNPDKSSFGNSETFDEKLMSNKGQDTKMMVSITIPAFIGIFLFILLILCCTSAAGKVKEKKTPSSA